MRPPILITGAPRSGVTLTAGLLELSGAFGGRVGQANHYTHRFIHENISIRHKLVKPFLAGRAELLFSPEERRLLAAEREHDRYGDGFGSRIEDVAALKEIAPSIAESWRRQVVKIMRAEGYSQGPWYYKSPVSALIWPVWAAAFPDARWIIVRRADQEIIQAGLETKYMRDHRDVDGWRRWLEVYKARFGEMIAARLRVWQFWPARVMEGDLQELHEMVQAMGLAWRTDELADRLAPALWQSGIYSLRG